MESGSPPPTPDASQGRATSGASESSPNKWISEEIGNRLIVATLVASVTFAAGIALPGGYNLSSDPDPGVPSMLYSRGFQVFVIFNAFAMYSSILSILTLLQAHNADHRKAKKYLKLAGSLLSMAIIFLTVAFSASLILAVSKLKWLKIFCLCFGIYGAAAIYMFVSEEGERWLQVVMESAN
ncbi:protein ACCELERATED CELL DEATH 6-like [Syzygium oleosum]|uniref:protein ACCELERATED CELL DEATH 6-like n=1 Tax=Syzygium oleosum TaxID=219896 RepID=UPI0011D22AB3|nr:protein ACCELERATED CELL DEATH 6-like [Syzygium oleosum]